jgi:hypothetical protein
MSEAISRTDPASHPPSRANLPNDRRSATRPGARRPEDKTPRRNEEASAETPPLQATDGQAESTAITTERVSADAADCLR